MPVYEYKGLTSSGKNTGGLIDADNLAAAKTKLRKDGIFPTLVNEAHGGEMRGSGGVKRDINLLAFLSRVKPAELSDMTRLLSTLIGASVPLVESLSALITQVENPKLKSTITALKDSVNEGSALGVAMDTHPDVFSNLYINMVKAGEASGTLDVVLAQLADFSEKQVNLTRKIKSALTYPIVMACIAFVILIILFTFVIPKITSIYSTMKASLPLPTVVLIGISDIFVSYWWGVLIVIGLAIYFFKSWLSKPKGRRSFDGFLLRMPVFGRIFRLVALARFTSTLATLLSSGVPLLPALNIVKNILNNVILKEAIENAAVAVSEGANLADPLRESGQFPPVVIQMIAIGEKTGRIEEMLEKVSKSYDQQTESTVSTLTSLLEPIMMVFMGGTVGFVVLAVMLPIFNLNQLAR